MSRNRSFNCHLVKSADSQDEKIRSAVLVERASGVASNSYASLLQDRDFVEEFGQPDLEILQARARAVEKHREYYDPFVGDEDCSSAMDGRQVEAEETCVSAPSQEEQSRGAGEAFEGSAELLASELDSGQSPDIVDVAEALEEVDAGLSSAEESGDPDLAFSSEDSETAAVDEWDFGDEDEAGPSEEMDLSAFEFDGDDEGASSDSTGFSAESGYDAWGDLELDEFEEDPAHSGFSAVDTDGKVSSRERALQVAEKLALPYGWNSSGIRMLAEVLGACATRRASTFRALLADGVTPDDLVIASEVRDLWSERLEYKVRVNLRSGVYSSSLYQNLSWENALRLVRAFGATPELDEIEYFLSELLDQWYCRPGLSEEFTSFFAYLMHCIETARDSADLYCWPGYGTCLDDEADWERYSSPTARKQLTNLVPRFEGPRYL